MAWRFHISAFHLSVTVYFSLCHFAPKRHATSYYVGLFFLFSISLCMISIAVPLRGFISQYSVSIAIDIYYRQAYSITINWILVCYLPWLDWVSIIYIRSLSFLFCVYFSSIYIYLFVFILVLYLFAFIRIHSLSMAYVQTYLMLLCLSVRACLLSRQSLLPWLSYIIVNYIFSLPLSGHPSHLWLSLLFV